MQTKKEQWIDVTMSSADTLKKRSISSDLKNRLEAIPRTIEIRDIRIPLRSVVLAAACILALITINIFSIRASQNKSSKANDGVYSAYFSYLNEI